MLVQSCHNITEHCGNIVIWFWLHSWYNIGHNLAQARGNISLVGIKWLVQHCASITLMLQLGQTITLKLSAHTKSSKKFQHWAPTLVRWWDNIGQCCHTFVTTLWFRSKYNVGTTLLQGRIGIHTRFLWGSTVSTWILLQHWVSTYHYIFTSTLWQRWNISCEDTTFTRLNGLL